VALPPFLHRQRPRAVRAVDAAIGGLAALRRRIATGGPAAGGGAGYGGLWRPRDDDEARRLILNDGDPEAFERAGQADAERLAELFGPDDAVLDLGCGIGRVARYVAPNCRELWAVDASEAMLASAQRRLEGLPNVSFARGEGTAMPAVPTESIDMAYSLLTLQHLEREDAFALLRDLRRVLRLGGRAFLTFPNLLSDTYLDAFVEQVNRGEVANPARARAYTPQEVERLLPAAGLAVERLDSGVELAAVCRRSG
jgi:ubiquinone/menaquinone biosynthesis C-methylase UbiE